MVGVVGSNPIAPTNTINTDVLHLRLQTAIVGYESERYDTAN